MGKKILLADDSITIQKVIELTFSDEDFEVVTVGNGRLAVEKLEEVRPDIVLCDIIMPEKDGYEVCDHIKKHPSFGHVPVLLLTGAFEPFDQERAARVGCDGFLAKPFEPQSLITKVKDLLSQAASRPRPAAAVSVPAPPLAAATPYHPPEVVAAAPAPVSAPMAFPPDEPEFEAMAEPEPYEPAASAESGPGVAPAIPYMAEALEEPVRETPAGTYHQPMDLSREPDAPLPPYMPAPAVEARAQVEEFPAEDAVVAHADEFMPLMADEAESLQPSPASSPRPPAAEPTPAFVAPEEEDGARTAVFPSGPTPSWSSPTVELPLETRAQAGVAAAAEAAARPVFAEPPPAPALDETSPPQLDEPAFEPDFGEPAAPEPPPASEPAPALVAPHAPPPAPEPVPAVASFADIRPEEPQTPEPLPSQAAEVAVPMEQVAQIAQRVVAQISERVVREVAWEVIPDLAEALIKKEIERLRAELEKA